MELAKAIKERRSIRNFKPDPVPQNLLQELLDLAMWAPSAMNLQDWFFAVIQGPKKEEFLKISASAFALIKPDLEKAFQDKPKIIAGMKTFYETFGGAPVIIMAYGGKLAGGQDDVWSVSLAVQNLMLAAYERGMGTTWMDGVVFAKEKEINALLGIKDRKLICAIPIGYPAEEPRVPPRRPNKIAWMGF
ncbi:MAG TPA: nitroreductase family protein [Smithellaceae bacterium]|nr:nitroreductase family protein [Smithellaceae bacterium]